MGSASSNSIKKAEKVDVDHHNNLLEIRFDHLAVGGTLIIVFCILLLAYKLIKKRCSKRTSTNPISPSAYNTRALMPAHPAQPGASAPGVQLSIVWHVKTSDVINIMSRFGNSCAPKDIEAQVGEATKENDRTWDE